MALGPVPIDKIPKTLRDLKGTTGAVKDSLPCLGRVLEVAHNFRDSHRDVKMGITEAVGGVINKSIGIAFIAKIPPWVNKGHNNCGESGKGKEETNDKGKPHRGGCATALAGTKKKKIFHGPVEFRRDPMSSFNIVFHISKAFGMHLNRTTRHAES
jgi:hypothetical protein